MLVGVEDETKKVLKAYGFRQILIDNELKTEDVLQILVDHGYIVLDGYTEDE